MQLSSVAVTGPETTDLWKESRILKPFSSNQLSSAAPAPTKKSDSFVLFNDGSADSWVRICYIWEMYLLLLTITFEKFDIKCSLIWTESFIQAKIISRVFCEWGEPKVLTISWLLVVASTRASAVSSGKKNWSVNQNPKGHEVFWGFLLNPGSAKAQ